ncbi:MAG: NAD(P)H-dependent oxidoreductase [Mycobacterium sp.]|nr:NAD(P)H-dependent oxidoreductase [Mycobacterium sp.]
MSTTTFSNGNGQRRESATLQLKLIVGSTRPGRTADRVLPWMSERARSDGRFTVEVLDLRDWDLPMFAESQASIGDPSDPTYSSPDVRRWNHTVSTGDAYIFLTPEYNHSIPGALKNAIDSVFASYALRNKPAGVVAYSAGRVGGARAVEHLALIAVEAELIPLRNAVLIPTVHNAFDASGEPTDPRVDTALAILLDDLAWWAELLRSGRKRGALPPAGARTMSRSAPAAS